MQPQPGIFAFGTSEHWYAELDLVRGADARTMAVALAELQGDDGPLVATGAVVGLRPELWASVSPGDALPGARSFEEIDANGCTMPATQHDAWLWLAGSTRDDVYDSARGAVMHLAGCASLASEVSGWAYLRHRDLTGFVDGTENPSVVESQDVALAPDGPGAGSSVVLYQLWEHLRSFEELTVAEQEAVIGRTKADSVELEGAAMPPDSHVSRTVVEEDGEELAIFRRNTAWGLPGRHGTVFVGFCAQRHPLQVMLERMAGIPDGTRDALTRHTVALSGAYYVVPSVDALGRLLPPS